MRELPAPKEDFDDLDGIIHLATGGQPPLLVEHRSAFEDFARDKAAGMDGYRAHWAVIDAVRSQLAALLSLTQGDIALTSNASEAITKVVASFDWQPNDNVVVAALDYASGRFALGRLAVLGVEVRIVSSNGWTIDSDILLRQSDSRTQLVYISQVNALTGQEIDIAKISGSLSGTTTALLVDASHALGVVPVPGDLCDFVVSSCYKFLLGVHDGVLGWNRARWPDFVPAGAGWHSATSTAAGFSVKADAQRAEYGNVGHLGAYLLKHSIDYLNQFGVDAIASRVRPLTQRLVGGMTDLGLPVMTPVDPAQQAANAAFHHLDTGRFVRRAREDGILVWGDNNRIRASVHLFTTDADVDLFLERLPNYLD